jgi:hypothetical protein
VALQARREKARENGAGPLVLQAQVRAEGRSGVRRIRIRSTATRRLSIVTYNEHFPFQHVAVRGEAS